jgi:hypothetical protein
VPRFVIPGEVGAWVASGRWGPRRLRVEECSATLVAETAYDFVIFDDAVRARARGELTWRVGERIFPVQWELRANHLWRFGRVSSAARSAGDWQRACIANG